MNQNQIAVVGAGTMGAGIAQVSVQAGMDTILYDISQEFVERGLSRIRGFIQRNREKGKLSKEEEGEMLSRLRGSLKLDDFRESSIVIEAAPEKLELKRDLFRQLDAICVVETLLATNTSSLSVTAVAGATRHPERVLGMHFFNPPPLMALVEIIQGEQTGDATIQRALDISRRLGKTPVCAKDTPGFIVNRVARAFYTEALRILGEGDVQPKTIDNILKGAGGFPMGPFELMDLIGIDINLAVTESLYSGFFQEPRFRPSSIQQRMVLSGNLGRKTGRGFYTYGKN
ncbi:MAG: 3-hydroxybutyryl-CoA dehydrogenase [Deltaproteobacteria bacterium]|nr:3-hydroxybutyryl-CoA dehydrogenase [Deltaproteobacteria bacterium]